MLPSTPWFLSRLSLEQSQTVRLWQKNVGLRHGQSLPQAIAKRYIDPRIGVASVDRNFKVKVLILLAIVFSSLIIIGTGQALNMTQVKTQDTTSVGALMEDYQWQNRVLLVFAPDSHDVQLAEQVANLSELGAGLSARDLVVWQLVNEESASMNGEVDASLLSQSFYDYFSVEDTDFTVILLGKDGTSKLRQTQPITSDRLFALIDAMPMRQREMRERGR